MSQRGRRGCNGGITGTTMSMSSAGIVSAVLTLLTLLCCCCQLHHRFVPVFAVAVLVFFIAVWRHCCHRRSRRHRHPHSSCRRYPSCLRRCLHCPVIAATFLAVDVALVVDCCVLSPRGRTTISLFPWGRFRHGPCCHSSLCHSSRCHSHCPHHCNYLS